MAKSEISRWMPVEIDRFFASPRVQAMRDFQRWWYMALLMRAWQFDPPCHLPSDQKQLRILAGCPPEKLWKEYGKLVTDCFDAVGDSGLVANQAQLGVYHSQLVRHLKNQSNGKKGAEARWRGYGEAIPRPCGANGNKEVDIEVGNTPPTPPKGGRLRGPAAKEPGKANPPKCDFCGGSWPCENPQCREEIEKVRTRVEKASAKAAAGGS